jgi:hypothetical protein
LTQTARLLAAFAACFLVACGIEYYVYLYPVSTIDNNPTNASSDEANYYAFVTRDEDNIDDADEYFLGFEIYYRIFNSVSDASADVTLVDNKNTNDPSNVGTYLQETLGYQRLRASGAAYKNLSPPLIPRSPADWLVKVRLTDSQSGNYQAGFYTEDLLGEDVDLAWGDPFRTTGSNDDSDNLFDWDKIDNGDDDVEYTSSESTDTWYVNAFVVAIGMDQNYRRLYSEAKFLGRSFIEDID